MMPDSARSAASSASNPAYGLNLAVFLLGALGTAGALYSGLLPIETHSVGETPAFSYFARHRDEFDVVFLGSSYTGDQVDVAVFDAQCGLRGHSVRSINLAYAGSTFYKVDDEIRRVLALRPSRLKYVVMDLRAATGEFRETDRGTEQAVRWHSPLQTRRALRRLWSTPAPLRIMLRDSLLHVDSLARNLVRGVSLASSRHPPPGNERVPGRDFQYNEYSADVGGTRSTKLRSMIDAYRTFDPDQSLSILDLDALDSQIQLLDEHDVQPVWVATPSLKQENIALRRLASLDRIPFAILLDDPDDYPWLFESRHRLMEDPPHLARTSETIGAYSRLLADHFVDNVLETH